MNIFLIILIFILLNIWIIFLSFRASISYDNNNDNYYFIFIIISCIMIIILACAYISKDYDKPSALDVYRNNTTLQVTYQDSIPIDSIVVFKNNLNK